MGAVAESRPSAESRSKWQELVRNVRRYWYCYLMMSGTFALLLAFAYYPAFSAFYHSFTNWDGFRQPDWVGIRNYQEVFTSEEIFGKGFRNMFILAAWQIFRSSVFPLLGAALLYRVKSEKTAYFFRLLFVLPIVIPGLVGILVWRQLYDPNVGLFNEILVGLGLKRLAWLNSPDTALFSLIFMGFPWIDGVGLLIYLAGFLAIPLEIIEAAIMDGAGTVRRFFSMELPLIIPQIRLIVILNVIGSFQNFGWQLLVTRGGPAGSTTVPAWSMYKAAMNEGRYGVASAIGVVLFILIFALTLINQAAIRSDIEYEAH
ncbi:MAG: carbohydrate ABC transporter permease [Anaerolineae bacterium]|jgi:raffinose/stachyose/melibiose transport system permease protein